jgi:hypothetical protein
MLNSVLFQLNVAPAPYSLCRQFGSYSSNNLLPKAL